MTWQCLSPELEKLFLLTDQSDQVHFRGRATESDDSAEIPFATLESSQLREIFLVDGIEGDTSHRGPGTAIGGFLKNRVDGRTFGERSDRENDKAVAIALGQVHGYAVRGRGVRSGRNAGGDHSSGREIMQKGGHGDPR
jgi:hypothetical protein